MSEETIYRVHDIAPRVFDTGALTGVATTSIHLVHTDDGIAAWVSLTGAQIAECAGSYSPSWVFINSESGEPTTHDLSELTINLMASKFSIALETNGSRYQDCMKCMDWITVSPKWRDTDNVDSLVVGISHEVKFVVSNVDELRRSFDFVKRFHINPAYTICLQPSDMSAELMNMCYNTVITMGWRLAVPLNRLITVN